MIMPSVRRSKRQKTTRTVPAQQRPVIIYFLKTILTLGPSIEGNYIYDILKITIITTRTQYIVSDCVRSYTIRH